MKTWQTGKQIVERARRAKQVFGDLYPKKFGGAAAIEILRDALLEEGIATSRRDVYIRGIPFEIDLIIPRKSASPWMELVFEPEQVAVALEVKKTGSYGANGLEKIKNDCVQLKNAQVEFAYISFEDRENYKYRPTEDKVGCRCFNLTWHDNTDGTLWSTFDWEDFVKYLKEILA